jgi:hypothetical protein
MTEAMRRAAEMAPWNSGQVYTDMLNELVKRGRTLLQNKKIPDAIKTLEVGRDLAGRMKYSTLFLWLAEAYWAQAKTYSAAERAKADKWLQRANDIVQNAPAFIPPEEQAAWDNLKVRLTPDEKSRGMFGFLRK